MFKYTYFIIGLHCPSCVLVIEDRLEKEKGIESVDVNLKKETITIESKKVISLTTLNQIFKKNNYHFFDKNLDSEENNIITLNMSNLWWLWAILIIGIFLFLSKYKISS